MIIISTLVQRHLVIAVLAAVPVLVLAVAQGVVPVGVPVIVREVVHG
jgi:hypothetical protein